MSVEFLRISYHEKRNIDRTVDEPIPSWTLRLHSHADSHYHQLQRQYCRLELLNSKTDENIVKQPYESYKPNEDIYFKYMSFGPFKTVNEYKEQVVRHFNDPVHDTVLYTVFVDDA